jgi:hypothetical protein
VKAYILSTIRDNQDGTFTFDVLLDSTTGRSIDVLIPLSSLIPNCATFSETEKAAFRLGNFSNSATQQWWLFRRKLVRLDGVETFSEEECCLEVMHVVLRRDRRYKSLRRAIRHFEAIETAESVQREPIPEEVRIFVWQRDQGKCVRCGSNERLEFDHVIPVVRGGSSTARNIQLLCERCNREKGSRV